MIVRKIKAREGMVVALCERCLDATEARDAGPWVSGECDGCWTHCGSCGAPHDWKKMYGKLCDACWHERFSAARRHAKLEGKQ